MGTPDGPPIVVDDHCKLYREESPAMKSTFEAASRGRAFVGEWRDDEADAFGVADRVLQYARAVDLVVAAQTDPQWAASDSLDVADRLAMECVVKLATSSFSGPALFVSVRFVSALRWGSRALNALAPTLDAT